MNEDGSQVKFTAKGSLRWRRRTSAVAIGVLLIATACAPAPQTNIGATAVSKWKDGKRAVYLLSFDDNLPSQLTNVIPELIKRKIHGTFYVIPGSNTWIETEPQWVEAAQSPYVTLGNHTFTHQGVNTVTELDTELANCNLALYRIYANRPQPFLMAWGQPGGVPWGVTPEQQADALKQNNLVERPPFKGSPSNYTTQEGLLASVDEALAQGEMGHDDMHGVGGDYLTTPIEWFRALLDQLKAAQDLLWIPDVVSYTKYLTERQTAVVKLHSADNQQIRLELTSSADSKLYDYPLTLTTRVPTNWNAAMVTQGVNNAEVEVMDGVVMYDATPGGGEVRVAQK